MADIVGEVDGFPRVSLVIDRVLGTEMSFVVDTGFNGEIVVPPSDAFRFGRSSATTLVQLASGEQQRYPFIEAEIEWDGEQRVVQVIVMDGNALIGLELMEGHRLTIDVTRGGEVLIEPL